MLLDDSAKILGISAGQYVSKTSTLFEGTWALLLHLHFIFVCNQNSFEYKAQLFDVAPSSGAVTRESKDAVASTKQRLEGWYKKPQSELSSRSINIPQHSDVSKKVYSSIHVTKSIYSAIHDTLTLLLEQSVHCLFLSSPHDIVSGRFRNRVILQIFLEGTNMNQLDQGVFSTTQSSTASSRPPSSDNAASASGSVSTSLPPIINELTAFSDSESSSHNQQTDPITPAFDSTIHDSTNSSASTISASSPESLMLFSRGASTTSRRDSAQQRTPVKRSSLGSIDALRDQGNIKYLIDFIMLFIREDFKLNASNLFATRCILISITCISLIEHCLCCAGLLLYCYFAKAYI
jgi:hypothetical protein